MADGSTTSSNFPSQQQQGKSTTNRLCDGKVSSKHGNIIHRTTSESLRLAGSDLMTGTATALPPSSSPSLLINAANSSAQSSRNKSKNSSFQITSVTVGPRMSADNGDDSADDLDESHTDDNSRITDLENETPSFSEDTFSKEDVFFSSSGIGTAPVIPTSSQYGLAIVAPDPSGSGNQSISDVHVSVTDAGINIMGGPNKHDVDLKDMHNRNERFKVVKIESTEPFKRGRWMCMDYLDHTTLQQSNSPSETSAAKDGTADSGIVINENEHDNTNEDSPNKTVRTEINVHNLINANLMAGQSAPGGGYPSSASTSPGQTLSHPLPSASETNEHIVTSHAQTMSHVPVNETVVPNMVAAAAPAQSLPPQQFQQILTQVSNSSDPVNLPGSNNTESHTMQPIAEIHQQPELQQQSSQQQHTQHHNAMQGQSQPAHFYSSNLEQTNHCQGQTLPAGTLQNIIQHGGLPQQPIQVPSVVNISSVPCSQTTIQDHSLIQSNNETVSNTITDSSQNQTLFQQQSNINNQQPQPVVTSIANSQENSTSSSNYPLSNNNQPAGQSAPISASIGAQLPPAQPQQPANQQQPSVSISLTGDTAQLPQQQPLAPTAFVQPIIQQQSNFDQSSSSAGSNNNPNLVITSNVPPTSSTVVSTNIDDNVNNVQPGSVAAVPPLSPAAMTTVLGGGGTEQPPPPPPQITSELLNEVGAASSTAVSAPSSSGASSIPAASATGDESSQPTEENESFSTFAKMLTGQKNPHLPNLNFSNQRPKRSDSSQQTNDIYPSIMYSPGRRESKIFTNLALGVMDEATGSVQQQNSFRSIVDGGSDGGGGQFREPLHNQLYPHKNIQKLIDEESLGIRIPKRRTGETNRNLTASCSSSGSSSVNTLCYGSPGTSPVYSSSYLDVYGDSGGGSRNASRSTSPRFLSSSYNGNTEYSASGASAVAIDNKIEQAMDLVKSHLMFAVREEVEVLKEKIAELMDRINQLELENTILKANASQETLSQLLTIAPVKPQPQNPNNPSNGSMS